MSATAQPFKPRRPQPTEDPVSRSAARCGSQCLAPPRRRAPRHRWGRHRRRTNRRPGRRPPPGLKRVPPIAPPPAPAAPVQMRGVDGIPDEEDLTVRADPPAHVQPLGQRLVVGQEIEAEPRDAPAVLHVRTSVALTNDGARCLGHHSRNGRQWHAMQRPVAVAQQSIVIAGWSDATGHACGPRRPAKLAPTDCSDDGSRQVVGGRVNAAMNRVARLLPARRSRTTRQ